MSPGEATALQKMMESECSEYLLHFTAFSEPSSLSNQISLARRDAFFSLFVNDCLAGFFCLRGLDLGYVRPSFGVYVASEYQGQGLARSALREAESWCRKNLVPAIMLKVAEKNRRAFDLYRTNGFRRIGFCARSGQMIMEKRLL